MKIAICDDDANVLNQIRDYILREVSSSNCEITCFSDGESLLRSDYTDIDIIFLDIEIGEMLGTEIAKTIKNQNPQLVIFFVTSYTSYISEAFKSMPFQYLVKPIDERLFKEEFARAIETLKENKDVIELKWNGEILLQKIMDILYLETRNRKTIIMTVNGELYTSMSRKDYEKHLGDYNFAKPHNSYFVNLRHVERIKGYEIELSSHEIILASKSFLKAFREKFRAYISGVAL